MTPCRCSNAAFSRSRIFETRRHVDLDHDVRMRRRLPAANHVLGNRLSNLRERNDGIPIPRTKRWRNSRPRLRGRRSLRDAGSTDGAGCGCLRRRHSQGSRRSGQRGRPARKLPRVTLLHVLQHVLLCDPPPQPTPGDLPEIHAVLPDEHPDRRRQVIPRAIASRFACAVSGAAPPAPDPGCDARGACGLTTRPTRRSHTRRATLRRALITFWQGRN